MIKVVVAGFITVDTVGEVLTIKTTHDLTLLAVSFNDKFIDRVVTIVAGAVLQVEVVRFITLNTMRMVKAVKAV